MTAKVFDFKQFSVRREYAGMKLSTDSVLLGAWTADYLIRRSRDKDLQQSSYPDRPVEHILDIGTGSGCIAISLALQKDTNVTAWDFSEKALSIARKNAEMLKATVSFECQDILKVSYPQDSFWDIIISNPPYICKKEAALMETNVLDHEPHEALFVPDEEPLLFYEAIGKYAIEGLKTNGLLAFEINPLYANQLYESLSHQGFHDISILNDSYGKQRFILCYK